MAVNCSLGIAGRPRGVKQTKRLPFISGTGPGEIGIALRQQRFMGDGTGERMRLQWRAEGDHQYGLRQFGQRLCGQGGIFSVHDQNLRPAMLERKGDHRGVEPGVERVRARRRAWARRRRPLSSRECSERGSRPCRAVRCRAARAPRPAAGTAYSRHSCTGDRRRSPRLRRRTRQRRARESSRA